MANYNLLVLLLYNIYYLRVNLCMLMDFQDGVAVCNYKVCTLVLIRMIFLPTALAWEVMESPPSVCPSVCFQSIVGTYILTVDL